MAQAARALGLDRTFYSKQCHRDRFDLGAFLATLRELDISPTAFFFELEGGGDPILWCSIRESSTPEIRRAVRRAYRRMRTELASVDLVAELEDIGAAVGEIPAAVADDAVLGGDWVAGLNGRRLQEDPEAVAAELVAGLDQVTAALLPATLGAWSSALCLLLELEAAAYLSRWAITLARAAGDSSMAADLFIRRSHVVADGGDYENALTLAELAAGTFARLGDKTREGRALEDVGRWLLYLNRPRESIAARKRALDLLPESESRFRLAAFCNLAHGYLAIGEPQEAERRLSAAEALVSEAALPDQAKVVWLRGSIYRKLGRLDESERAMRRVVEVFRKLHVGETALAACDLVRVILEQGKPAEAARVCQDMRPLLEPLRSNRIVDAAVGELVLAGAVGSLSLDLIRRVKGTIAAQRNDARARRAWSALGVGD